MTKVAILISGDCPNITAFQTIINNKIKELCEREGATDIKLIPNTVRCDEFFESTMYIQYQVK